MQALGGKKKDALVRKVYADTSKGCEDEDGPSARKVPRTKLDTRGVSREGTNQCREMWLVKVPPAVWKAWEKVEEGGDAGQLVVTKDAQGQDDLHVRLNGKLTEVEGGRKCALPNYSLKGMRVVNDSLVFSQSKLGEKEGGHASLDAVVVRSYTMQPHVGEQYRGLMQNRMVASTIKEKYVKHVDRQEAVTQNKSSGGGSAVFQKGINEILSNKQAATAAANAAAGLGEFPAGKKVRMESSELRSKLFVLFSQAPRYSFKELNLRLNQPEEHLKGVLRDICMMHRGGQYRNMYELKTEFQDADATAAAHTAAAAAASMDTDAA